MLLLMQQRQPVLVEPRAREPPVRHTAREQHGRGAAAVLVKLPPRVLLMRHCW
jgi:hypothetical protein